MPRGAASAARAVRPAWGTSRPGRSALPRGSARPAAGREAAVIRPAHSPMNKFKRGYYHEQNFGNERYNIGSQIRPDF